MYSQKEQEIFEDTEEAALLKKDLLKNKNSICVKTAR
jgi:hypothetical protein